jgi:hypothetical protein
MSLLFIFTPNLTRFLHYYFFQEDMPSLGKLRFGGLQFEASLGKKFLRVPPNKWMGAMTHTCHTAASEAEIRKICKTPS